MGTPDKRFKTKGDARFKKPTAALKFQNDERFSKRFTDQAFREGARVDPRGRRREDDSEVSSESSDSESDDIDIDDRVWEAPDHNAIRKDESSKRLSFMCLDWGSISAEDILSVCRSSVRRPEEVSNVMIFPSEIGKEILEKEAMEGPQFEESKEDDPDEAIRKYNRERSTYYYAVVFCDNTKVAEGLYDDLDGVGVPSLCAGWPLDVRFIPDDIEFPYPHVSEATKVSRTYEAHNETAHTRGGLEHTKALCNWDEDNPKRKKDLIKKMTKQDIEENDLKVYLASESEDEDAAKKRKLLLGDCAESSDGAGTDAGSDFFEESESDKEKTATFYPEMDKIVEEVHQSVKVKEAGSAAKKSAWEMYLEKKKLKKKERRQKAMRDSTEPTDEPADSADAAELELLMHERGHDRDFNLKKRKRNEPDESGFKENVCDERLQKMFDDPDFALDPTHPSYKKSKTMDKFLETTRKRKKKVKVHNAESTVTSKNIPAESPDIRMFA